MSLDCAFTRFSLISEAAAAQGPQGNILLRAALRHLRVRLRWLLPELPPCSRPRPSAVQLLAWAQTQPLVHETEGWEKLKKTVVTNQPFATVAANAPSLVCGQTVFCPQAKRKDNNSKQLARGTNTMKVNQWTLGLAAAGVISFGAVAQAEEKPANQVLTAVSSTCLSGYVNTSAQWNPGSLPGAAAGYSYAAGKGDGFNLNVVDIAFHKPLDEGEWAAGYTAELWMGPDAAGIGNSITGAAVGAATLSIKQAYVALNAPIGNGITLKMGVFDTIIGYEAANAGDNPNYTRSYGYTIEPTQHTGVLASYKVCDAFSVSAGIANTYNAAINTRAGGVAAPVSQSQKTYMAGISLTAPDSWGFLKGAVLNAGVVDGRLSTTALAASDTTSLYVGATIPTPWETIKTGVSWDHLQFARPSGTAAGAGGTADADAIGAYVAFSGIEKLKINGRVEFLNDADGGNVIVGGTDVLAATVTLDYALWANVISRLEYRWDHDLKQRNSLGGNSLTTAAGAGAGANNNHLVALNIIYKF